MRSLALGFLGLAAVFVDGCACGFPFDSSREAQVKIDLGDVQADCTDSGSETRENGDVVSWNHSAQSNRCHLSSTWAGVLLDMEEVHTQVEDALADSGVDPASVKVTITTIDITVTKVDMTDADGNHVEIPGLLSYVGSVDVGDEEGLIVAEMAEGGDPTDPDVSIKEGNALAEMATTAYADNENVLGEGSADTFVNLADVAPLEGIEGLGLTIDFTLDIAGTAGL